MSKEKTDPFQGDFQDPVVPTCLHFSSIPQFTGCVCEIVSLKSISHIGLRIPQGQGACPLKVGTRRI